MWELFSGQALFGKPVVHFDELTLLSKIILASITILGVAALVMTIISLVSLVLSGAPFVATSKRLTRKIVALADIRPSERVYDLGCGDGRFLIVACKFYKARAIGIEISPLVYALAKLTVWLNRADVEIHRANFKTYDFYDADVIFCYLGPEQMAILGKKIKELKRGCRIVCRRFEIPGLEPQQHIEVKKRFGLESVFIYRT